MLSEVQRLLVAAAHARDPHAALQAGIAAAGALLSAAERAWLASIDADGLRVTALLVKKLRFERIVLGDEALGARFDADPRRFTRQFERYAREVPPSFAFPGEEAEAFSRWLADSERDPPAAPPAR